MYIFRGMMPSSKISSNNLKLKYACNIEITIKFSSDWIQDRTVHDYGKLQSKVNLDNNVTKFTTRFFFNHEILILMYHPNIITGVFLIIRVKKFIELCLMHCIQGPTVYSNCAKKKQGFYFFTSSKSNNTPFLAVWLIMIWNYIYINFCSFLNLLFDNINAKIYIILKIFTRSRV